MYCVQFCYEDYSKVVAIFNDKGLAIEYAIFKKRCVIKKRVVGQNSFTDKICAIEILYGDKQIERILLPFDMQ